MGRYLIFKTTILKYGIQILRLDLSKIKKRCTVSDSLAKNEKNIARKIRIFRMFLTVFPFLMPNSESLPSLLAHSLFFKRATCANRSHRSHRSLQKSDRERFAEVADDKRATGANRSFVHNKRAN